MGARPYTRTVPTGSASQPQLGPCPVLAVGPTGRIKAELSGKSVVVLGKVSGSIEASERARIGESCLVEGAIPAPQLVVWPTGRTCSTARTCRPRDLGRYNRTCVRRSVPVAASGATMTQLVGPLTGRQDRGRGVAARIDAPAQTYSGHCTQRSPLPLAMIGPNSPRWKSPRSRAVAEAVMDR